jgi:hypothetical protein
MDIKEQLESYISFHEDKANYYNDWLNDIIAEEKTIGFKWHEICKEDENKAIK